MGNEHEKNRFHASNSNKRTVNDASRKKGGKTAKKKKIDRSVPYADRKTAVRQTTRTDRLCCFPTNTTTTTKTSFGLTSALGPSYPERVDGTARGKRVRDYDNDDDDDVRGPHTGELNFKWRSAGRLLWERRAYGSSSRRRRPVLPARRTVNCRRPAGGGGGGGPDVRTLRAASRLSRCLPSPVPPKTTPAPKRDQTAATRSFRKPYTTTRAVPARHADDSTTGIVSITRSSDDDSNGRDRRKGWKIKICRPRRSRNRPTCSFIVRRRRKTR